MLREGAIDYYSEVFAESYEEKYFNNLSKIKLEKCVEIFLNNIWGKDKSAEELIDLINRKNWKVNFFESTTTIGFTCFLIQKRKIRLYNLLYADSRINELFEGMLYSEEWWKRLEK